MWQPQLDRWQRKMQGKAGWTLPGTKRREYIDSLKPIKAKAKEPKMVGYQMTEGTGGQQNYQPYIIQNQVFNGGITVNGNLWYPPTTFSPYITTGSTATTTSANIIWPYNGDTTSASTITVSGNAWYDGGTGGNWNIQPIDPWARQNPPGYQGLSWGTIKVDPKVEKRERLRRNLITVRPGRGDYPAQFGSITKAEATALVLLKQMLPDAEWRRYLKDGFIVVRGATGLRYQIVRGQSHIKVYRRGDKIAELCLVVDGGCPPTDHVITKKIMVECDELGVWTRANIHNNQRWAYGMPRPTEQDLIQLAAA